MLQQLAHAAPRATSGKHYENCYVLNQLLRRLETFGKPVAAALNGLTMGGGLEWPWPATTASWWMTRAPNSASPRSRWGSCRAAAAPSVCRA